MKHTRLPSGLYAAHGDIQLPQPLQDVPPRGARHFMPPFSQVFAAPIATPGGAVVTTLILDQFTDVDTTLLPSHTIGPVNLPGHAWVAVANNLSIRSNHIYVTNPGPNICVVDSGKSDVTISFITQANQSYACADGIVFRYIDASNYWEAYWDFQARTFNIIQVQSGTPTTQASTGASLSPDTSYTVQVVISGTSITATIDAGSKITFSSSFNQTATSHGIVAKSGGAVHIFNFTVTTP